MSSTRGSGPSISISRSNRRRAFERLILIDYAPRYPKSGGILIPNTINTLTPVLATSLKSVRSSLDLSADMVSLGNRWSLLWLDSLNAASSIGLEMWRFLITGTPAEQPVTVLADSLEGMVRGMAKVLRMRRIAWADTARKWARFCQVTFL